MSTDMNQHCVNNQIPLSFLVSKRYWANARTAESKLGNEARDVAKIDRALDLYNMTSYNNFCIRRNKAVRK